MGEVAPWRALGPTGRDVAAAIERWKRATEAERQAVRHAQRDPAISAAASDATRVARGAATRAGRFAAWGVTGSLVGSMWGDEYAAAAPGARALLVRDLVPADVFDSLAASASGRRTTRPDGCVAAPPGT